MKNTINRYWNTEYSSAEWTFMKCSIALVWFLYIISVLLFHKPIAYPISFCELLNCNIIQLYAVKIFIAVCAFTALVFYVQEEYMLLSLAIISVISVFVFTIADSMGFYDRYDMMSCVFIAQFIAYIFFHGYTLSQRRVQFSIQVVAASYFIAAVNKLHTSGLNWAMKSEHFALQVMKGYSAKFANYGHLHSLQTAKTLSNFFISHPFVTELMLLISLFLELFSVLAVFDKRLAITIGTLLLFMHMGILLIMNISLLAIVPISITFLVNPLYLIYISASSIRKK